jgi:protein-tyrosine phosphatase
MIDLHAHILPAVDDGAADLEESLEMVREAAEDGIETVCATPHLLERPSRRQTEFFGERFSELAAAVDRERLPVRLILGAEIYFQPEMGLLSGHSGLTINGTGRYLLYEFPMQGIPPGADEILFQLNISGMIPILAHPERNLSVLRDETVLEPLLKSGTLLQINAGSLEGRFGRQVRKCALSLLKKGMAHFIGSDAHNAADRPVRLSPAVSIAAEVIGPRAARALVDDHPRCVLEGQTLPRPALSMPRQGTENLLGKIWRGFTGR